ncbi:MAG: DUF3592 domain-containing protein [Alphaproteobacteria bacterium]|nr:DUF3592 domain-containing protein [Alphaproteobacteria bacterium]
MDMIFNAVMAWNQVVYIIGGLILLAIGGFCFAYFVDWRVNAVRVKGKISGVRVAQSKMATKDNPPEENPPEASWEGFAQEFKKTPGTGMAALFFALLIIGVPLLFVGFGASFAWKYYDLSYNGTKTEGVVVDSEYQSSDDGGSYYSVVAFRDGSGREWRVKDNIGKGGSPFYDVGERVPVIYNSADPEKMVMGSYWHNMLIPAAFMGMGGLFLFLLFGRRHIKASRTRAGLPKKKDYGREIYYPVYEYRAKDGTLVTADDGGGSSFLANKIPGTEVELLVKPEDPDRVARPGFLSLLFAFVFGGPGLLLLWIALTSFESNIFTVVFTLAVMGWAALKLKKAIIPKDQRGTKEAFRQRMREKREARRQEGRLLTQQEIRERLQLQAAQSGWGVLVLLLVGTALLALGTHLGQGMRDLAAKGVIAEGEVIRIETERSNSSDGPSVTYRAVAAFQTQTGERREFRDSFGSNPAMYSAGDKVKVLYDPADPGGSMIDRGLWNWLPSGICLLAGALLLLAALQSYTAMAQRSNRR